MKRLLLSASFPALCLSALAADLPQPKVLESSNANAISANGRYVVADGFAGVKIFDLEDEKEYDYTEASPAGMYTAGFANCVSSNGIVVGYGNAGALYWKDGIWHKIKIPASTKGSTLVNSITPDGSRICGSIGQEEMSAGENDVLRQVPCIWNWNPEKGEFNLPVLLPHPDRDFTGRVPQLITAVGISDDGKTVVGQIQAVTGTVNYPIIYTENAEGEWSYEIPDYDILHPEGVEFPEYPGDSGPAYPSEESFMTPDEIAQYELAFEAYVNSGYTLPSPEYKDFMTAEEIDAYDKAKAEYDELAGNWMSKFDAWWDVFFKIIDKLPDYQYNSIRISPDGKKYANTILVQDKDDPYGATFSYVWVFDIESGEITKYEQNGNFSLTYLANDGIALAVTHLTEEPQSFVLTKGESIDMQSWISDKIPQYGSWMEENMLEWVAVYEFNEELGEQEIVYKEEVLTGRASATPDLSVIALGVTNVWDGLDDGMSYVFDMKTENSVSSITLDNNEHYIYDLAGRKLNKADAPGIYIINGEKRIIR